MPRILRLSLRSFFSSSVSNSPSSTIEPASGITLKAIGRTYFDRRRERHRRSVVRQLGGPVDGLADLLVELVDAGQAAARHRLVGRHDQPGQAGLVVQRLEHRHRRHRRAVRVGDDALRGVGDSAPLTSLTTSGTSGSIRQADELSMTIAPAAANRGASSRDVAAAGREQRDVEAGRVGELRRPRPGRRRPPTAASYRPSGPRRRTGCRRPGTLRSARIRRMTPPT